VRGGWVRRRRVVVRGFRFGIVGVMIYEFMCYV
jgi:hypothetical protein